MKGPAWDLYGIEMEESTAEQATAKTSAKVFVGDVLAAPFEASSFDVITCFDVLEHVYKPREFTMKVCEWLKPGGIFYAMMPNIDSWEAKLFRSYWFGLELPRHLSHFSPHSLRYLMRDIGFEEIIVKTPPISYFERSVGYVCADLLEKLGFSPAPQSSSKPLSLPLKVVRKGIRMGFIEPMSRIASLAGNGRCMEVVFKKSAN